MVVDYPAKGQVWFWFCTGAANEPNVLAKYTKLTGAWEVEDTGGHVRLARAAVNFPRTLGASMSRDRVPYVSYQGTANKLLRCDTTDTDEDGTAYQALVKSRPYALNNGQPFRVTCPMILAKVASGVTLTITADADFGRVTQSSTIDLTANADEGSATRVWRKAEGIDLECEAFIQLQIGDSAAVANTWQIERIVMPVLSMDAQP